MAYEERLQGEYGRLLRAASAHFEGKSGVYQTLLNLARRLDGEDIPYAIIGAMALGKHGLARMTEDVGVLMTIEGLAAFQAQCVGKGCVPAFSGSRRTFRDTDTQVRIELKLASGMSAPHRLRDLADVQDLIGALSLPVEFAEQLNESVRAEYQRLWQAVQNAGRERQADA